MLFIILIFFYTRIIINIEVLTNDQELNRMLLNELDKANISKYKFIKKEKQLGQIKENILTQHNNELEWLNIKRIGMKYIINLEPKVVANKKDNLTYCHVVSNKDATITKIYSESGMELKERNEYVKKGDIIISGDIKKDEEVKGHICAKGKVYGTTWYTITIEIPKTYKKTIKTKDKKYNILLKYNNKSKKIFKSQYENYIITNKKIINIFGLEIYLQKEMKSNIEDATYTDDELNKKIDSLVEEKMKSVLNGKGIIKHKNVLKKNNNNSKIYLDMFIVAEEEIGISVEATIPYDE